jgi:hypothetical protein
VAESSTSTVPLFATVTQYCRRAGEQVGGRVGRQAFDCAGGGAGYGNYLSGGHKHPSADHSVHFMQPRTPL